MAEGRFLYNLMAIRETGQLPENSVCQRYF